VTPAIQDHAIVGDGRSAALVARDGAVSWLCWPRFDSPSLFGALLDAERGGVFSIRPTGPSVVTRRYLGDTNVLETRFETADGACRITDAMTVAGRNDDVLQAEHELVRRVECDRGTVRLEVAFEPRPDYGREAARIRRRGALGLYVPVSEGVLILRTDAALEPGESAARGSVTLAAGGRLDFSLSFSQEAPAVIPPLGPALDERLARTRAWWSRWAARADYEGPYRDAVVRSALALKLLGYAPSGAIVAAPTTSLPERLGGDLDWDYRFCWLRDASFTAYALAALGYRDELRAFVSWLIHSTRLTSPELHVLYDVFGNSPAPERVLPHLRGYADSRPVRVGNAAHDQFQLDLYGEVVEAATQFARTGGELDRATGSLILDLGHYVVENWERPDHGIWETRCERVQHTHSLVLCWAALDRLVELSCVHGVAGVPCRAFERERERIRAVVHERGWNESLQSYTSTLGGTEVDASLLRLPWYGFEPADSPRMRSTYARIERELGARDGLLYRYRTGASPGEGAFALCGFWAVQHLARSGRAAEASRRFERLLGFANDVGLFGEEVDPATGAALGNFPQGFTHLGVINAALTLAEAQGQRKEAA
jgi:GH15 family glucan-1,4-alpha-glucosidase